MRDRKVRVRRYRRSAGCLPAIHVRVGVFVGHRASVVHVAVQHQSQSLSVPREVKRVLRIAEACWLETHYAYAVISTRPSSRTFTIETGPAFAPRAMLYCKFCAVKLRPRTMVQSFCVAATVPIGNVSDAVTTVCAF